MTHSGNGALSRHDAQLHNGSRGTAEADAPSLLGMKASL